MFSDMKPAERKLLEACQKGEILDLGNKSPTEKTAKNEIRGEFLRALILSNNQEIEESGKKYVLKIAPNGIIFSRVYVSGIFDFSFCSTDLKFSFRNSKFENRLDLSDSKIRFLSLIGSIVPSFDAFRLVCESDIFLKNGFEAHGKVNFGSAQIGGILSCINGKFINEKGDALNCNSAKIDGAVFLKDGFEAHGKVNFGSAQIGSNLECSKGKFINKEGDALNCNSVKIGGSVFLRDGFEAEGKVNFGLAQIENNLDCTKGKFINENGDALNCDKVKIGGSVFLRDGFEAEGKVNFNSAQIGSNLECSAGKLINKKGVTLTCYRSKIVGDVLLSNGFKSEGKVSFGSAQIGSSLYSINGKFINEKGDALNCDRTKIGGSVFLRDGFDAKGKVNFNSAQIGSDLFCDNGKFINEKGDALNCDRTKIGGSVFLRDSFDAKGKVNFNSAQIGSDLFCDNGKFINEKGDALNCDRTKIGGSVFLRDSFDAKGKVNFHSCFIGKSLIFSKSNGISFFSLNSAQISRLSLDFEKVKKIDLNGCIYEHLDSIIFSKVLEKMPKEDDFKPQPYKQLAKVLRNMGHHNEADDVMIEYNNKIFNMDFKDFKERFKNRISVFFKEKRNFFKNLFKSFFEALGFLVRLIYGKTAGYGYKPMRVIFTMFVILLSCGWFYQKTADMGIFAPSNPLIFQNTKYDSNVNKCGIPKLIWKGSYIAYKDEQDIFYCEYKNIEKQENIKNDNWTTNQNLEGEYTTFSPYWYSLDIIIPIVDLQMDKDWGVFISPINSNITLNHVTRWIVWIEILFGWIYSLILVAILSGLAKNEKD